MDNAMDELDDESDEIDDDPKDKYLTPTFHSLCLALSVLRSKGR